MSGASDTRADLLLRVAALEAQVRDLTAPLPSDVLDKPWHCLKCRTVLALDDEEANIIRVRMGRMMVMMSPGPGTWMQIVCPHCGNLNHADGPPMPDAAPSPGPAE